MAEPPVERTNPPSCDSNTQSCEKTGGESEAENDRLLQLAAADAGFDPVQSDRFQVEVTFQRDRPKHHRPEHYTKENERDRRIVHRMETKEQARAHEPRRGK